MDIAQTDIAAVTTTLQHVLLHSDRYDNRSDLTMIADSNVQRILWAMRKKSTSNTIDVERKTLPPNGLLLCGGCSAKHCLITLESDGNSCVLIGSDANGQDESARNCYPELLACCGESAVELYRAGLKLEDAVVPGIAIMGSAIQFCAVYLIPDVFPVMVALSPALDPLGSLSIQDEISKWCLRFIRFAEHSCMRCHHSYFQKA